MSTTLAGGTLKLTTSSQFLFHGIPNAAILVE
jgi:hypothetical protein